MPVKNGNGHAQAAPIKMPPCNLEAEACLIGCAFCDALSLDVDEVVDIKPEEFYDARNGVIWSAVKQLQEEGIGLNPVSIATRLNQSGTLDAAGGVEYLHHLANETVSHTWHADTYAKLITETSLARKAIYGCRELLDIAETNRRPSEILEVAERVLTDISEDAAPSRVFSVREILDEVMPEIQSRLTHGRPAGLQTGFEALDQLIVGLLPHELIVCAARPGVGKTAFALSLAMQIAKAGKAVLFVSLEMSRLEIGERMLAIEAGVDANALKHGVLQIQGYERELTTHKLLEAAERLKSVPILIEDRAIQGLHKIGALIRRMKRKADLGLIIVDYLNLIMPSDTRMPREQQVALSSRAMKCWAKENSVPVLALCQLNREIERRQDMQPRLSDLRESGAIEQDADVVMFLDRPEVYDPEQRPGEVDIIVRKNRRGRIGKATLAFVSSRTMFANLSTEQQTKMAALQQPPVQQFLVSDQEGHF